MIFMGNGVYIFYWRLCISNVGFEKFLVLFFLHSEQNNIELLWGSDFFLEQILPNQYVKSEITVYI